MQNSLTDPAQLAADFVAALDKLDTARSFSKAMHQNRVFAAARKLLRSPEGIHYLYESAPRFDHAGVFIGGDWAAPEQLQPALVRGTLKAGGMNAVAECLSELRLLAIAEGKSTHPNLSADQARDFLEQLLGNNLDMLFPVATEESRESDEDVSERVQALFNFLLDRLGAGGILEAVINEAERVLLQRPIMVQRIEALLRSTREAIAALRDDDPFAETARRWIRALEGPTALARTHRHDYPDALATLTPEALASEAETFGHSMAATGLVAAQHADLLNYLVDKAPELLGDALALDAVGQVSLDTHFTLIADIIHFAIWHETARSIYGLSRLLCQGTLFVPPVPPGLQRLRLLAIDERIATQLRDASEWNDPPNANVLLLAGALSVLGQPRGVDQGHNPTCQAARAISLWAQNDVGYLLELIAQAALNDELVVHFEGEMIRSSELSFGLATTLHTELDPVSLLLTPHLDRIYMEMSRRTIGRAGDGHRWVNPEFHGWWVHRGFAELIDAPTGAIQHCDHFIRTFYAAYHPRYNGGRDLVYAQPCGVAVTDYSGAFIGWHAISIQRVAADPQGEWRVYFFNPNRDKGQNWGHGVVTSTHEHGELEGESSLPFTQFASRLYVFHYKFQEVGEPASIPAEAVAEVRAAIRASWGAQREWLD